MSEELATLLAKQAITDRIHRYCRAMDRMDHDLAVASWHPGGTADYGTFVQGSGAGFVDWVEATHRGVRRHVHRVSNMLIEVDPTHRNQHRATWSGLHPVTGPIEPVPSKQLVRLHVVTPGDHRDRRPGSNDAATISRFNASERPIQTSASSIVMR